MEAKNSFKMKDQHEAFMESLNSMEDIFKKPAAKT